MAPTINEGSSEMNVIVYFLNDNNFVIGISDIYLNYEKIIQKGPSSIKDLASYSIWTTVSDGMIDIDFREKKIGVSIYDSNQQLLDGNKIDDYMTPGLNLIVTARIEDL